MIRSWTEDAWSDYEDWIALGEWKTVKRINKLIDDINRTPFEDLGKPEPLKHEFAGLWSRRITKEHRLIYDVASINKKQTIRLYSCRDHYE